MDFKIVDCQKGVEVRRLKGRALFIHGDSYYRVVDTIGDGVDIRNSKGWILITNQKIGTIREIKSDTRVIVLTTCQDYVDVRPATDEEIKDVCKY